jgi:hypothetical protein
MINSSSVSPTIFSWKDGHVTITGFQVGTMEIIRMVGASEKMFAHLQRPARIFVSGQAVTRSGDEVYTLEHHVAHLPPGEGQYFLRVEVFDAYVALFPIWGNWRQVEIVF